MKKIMALILSIVIITSLCTSTLAVESPDVADIHLVNMSDEKNTIRSIDKNKTFGLSPQTGEYEVITDVNFWKEDTVTVSLVSTQGPNPVKVRIYTKNSDGIYIQQKSGNITFESPLSCNINGAQFKVTAEYVDGITGNCTLNIILT